jgi:hypothetical protein
MENKEKSQEERIIDFFKYVVTIASSAITVIVAVSLYFTYSNLSELRNEAKQNVIDYKTTLKELNSYAQQAIDKTQEQTKKQIEIISQESKNLAYSITTEKVEEAFEKNNIQLLIESTAEQKLKDKLDIIISSDLEKATKIIDNQLNILPNFILAIDKIRAGDKRSYDYIDSISTYSTDTKIKKYAFLILQQKTHDYEEYVDSIVNDIEIKKIKIRLIDFVDLNKDILNSKDNNKIIKELLRIIDSNNDLNRIAFAFKALSEYNINIKFFDFKSARELMKKY